MDSAVITESTIAASRLISFAKVFLPFSAALGLSLVVEHTIEVGQNVFERLFGATCGRRWPASFLHAVVAFNLGVGLTMSSHATSADPELEQAKRERDQYIEQFRRTGTRDPRILERTDAQLRKLVAYQSGEARLRARLELATVTRLAERYADAAARYEAVATDARREGLRDIAFDAWIGMARAHSYGTRDHSAADRALENAILTVADKASSKQLHDLAAFRSQILAGRGDLDAALAAALEALTRAEEPADRFYAEFNTASVLLNFAESCDYHKLVDARTNNDPPADGWGACRRAVEAAVAGFERAGKTAEALGWAALAQQAGALRQDAGMRLFLINQRAGVERMRAAAVFSSTTASDVLVNQDFSAGGSALRDSPQLGQMINEAVSGESTDPRSRYLRGVAADMRNDRPAALRLFKAAAEGLATERKGLFDSQRRGTVIENRVEIMRDLGLALLAAGSQSEAFATFESFRSRGLGELAAALAQQGLSLQDREWLAAVLGIEARANAMDVRIRERVLATAALKLSDTELQELRERERERRKLLGDTARRDRFARASFRPAGLADLQRASRESGTPVLLYWVTPTNVLVWVVGPEISEVRTVFLPEGVLEDRVRRVVMTSREADRSGRIDEEATQQLYLYLIAPFERWLTAPRVMIVPQGSLVDLPFEALIDPRSGKYLVEERVVSYAPSATIAARILTSKPSVGRSIRAVVDEALEPITGEIESIRALGKLKVESVAAHSVEPARLSQIVGGVEIVHVLAHGDTDSADPLLASLKLSNDKRLTAAQLVAAPWSGVRLAVLSSCDSGAWTRRISNEIYGLPWALMVGGAANVVVSRWRVAGTGNAEWMARFYGALADQRASPAEAAAAASRGIIASGRRHPFHWAAMRVIGR